MEDEYPFHNFKNDSKTNSYLTPFRFENEDGDRSTEVAQDQNLRILGEKNPTQQSMDTSWDLQNSKIINLNDQSPRSSIVTTIDINESIDENIENTVNLENSFELLNKEKESETFEAIEQNNQTTELVEDQQNRDIPTKRKVRPHPKYKDYVCSFT